MRNDDKEFWTVCSQVKRERLMLPSVDDVLSQLSDARVFSNLDVTSGFYQIKLTPESALLTTFIAPFGQFYYKTTVRNNLCTRVLSEEDAVRTRWSGRNSQYD